MYCELENYRPFTWDHDHFVESRKGHTLEFSYQRNERKPSARGARVSRTSHTIRDGTGNFRSISQNEVSDDVLLGHLCAKGYPVTDIKQLAPLHGPDKYETELRVMADVLAYFDVSSKRTIDYMFMIFQGLFARYFGRDVRSVLTSKLNLVGKQGEQRCAMVAQDAEDVHFKRVKLIEDRRILSQALKILATS